MTGRRNKTGMWKIHCIVRQTKKKKSWSEDRRLVSPSSIIDFIHCSPLGTMNPETTPPNRRAVGETFLTPSDRGLVKSLGQREKRMQRDRPPINKNILDWILHCFCPRFQVIPSSFEKLGLNGALEVCGLERATKRKLKIAAACLANKEHHSTEVCHICSCHPLWQLCLFRAGLNLSLRPSAGSDVRVPVDAYVGEKGHFVRPTVNVFLSSVLCLVTGL